MGLPGTTAETPAEATVDVADPPRPSPRRWLRRTAVLLGFIGAGAGAHAAQRNGRVLAAPTAMLARMRR